MRGSGSGFRFSGAIAVAVALVLSCIVADGRADGLGAPLDYSSLVVADATLGAESPGTGVPTSTGPDSYHLSPLMVVDASRGEPSSLDEAEQSSMVPEPSGIVLGAFFAALLALVTLLRWRFDRTAVRP